ncbi:hypothetical protein BBK82_07245 [Lentzea guizhouensis]|uniref:Histidine kinase n=1 Tax=Lentzea guizhouensis TaxID=1586287 RepID=A0A1B2HDV7_9PSEU|nr:ATP-binding protein [Lentzea guizhouensis]ANZ35909.1 hypothetical protein BBK82_07245 [Lentzea guizhouensis]
MGWEQIRAGRDALGDYLKVSPLDAVAELVWNSLDAEADEVSIDIEYDGMGTDEVRYVSQVAVTDNGHGMSHERARSAFLSLGDSWKKGLGGRTVNKKRALHGKKGKGRFFVYGIGGFVRWTSVSATPDGNVLVEVVGEEQRMEGFSISEPVQTEEPTGTRVTVQAGEGRATAALVRTDFAHQLAARLAGHLLANDDITVLVNGIQLDPAELIDGEPVDIPLTDLDSAEVAEHEPPVLTIVDWTDEMRAAPTIVLCNEEGMALVELDKPVPNTAAKTTGYLKWRRFTGSDMSLALAHMQFPDVISAATKIYETHVRDRLGEITATIVTKLISEGTYPYDTTDIADPIRRTERDMFDLVAVTARSALNSGSRAQREMSARLLKLALEERSEDLDLILTSALGLTGDEREQLADMLKHSTLGNIVGAGAEVARRVELIIALRGAIYGNDSRRRMREVDQLHPLVKDNVWLFGEDWRLSRSEAGLTSVLRDVVHAEAVLEADLTPVPAVRRSDGRAGRLDLVLQRTAGSPGDQHRLVVELKRPSLVIGDKELTQVKTYARTLSKHPAVGASRWTFWLVGADIGDDIEEDVNQVDRAQGHVVKAKNYDIWVTHWGQLLDNATRRLEFYRDQLKYDITQEAATERVRQRHGELLPPEEPMNPAPRR